MQQKTNELGQPRTGGVLNFETDVPLSLSIDLFRRITARIDDDMIRHYCNEDIFILEVRQYEEDLYDITLTELPTH